MHTFLRLAALAIFGLGGIGLAVCLATSSVPAQTRAPVETVAEPAPQITQPTVSTEVTAPAEPEHPRLQQPLVAPPVPAHLPQPGGAAPVYPRAWAVELHPAFAQLSVPDRIDPE